MTLRDVLCALLVLFVVWTGGALILYWYFSLPEMRLSAATGHCVSVVYPEDPDRYSCENPPGKYIPVYVQ